jgi:hypothetical protein
LFSDKDVEEVENSVESRKTSRVGPPAFAARLWLETDGIQTCIVNRSTSAAKAGGPTLEVFRLSSVGSLSEHLGELLVHLHHLLIIPDLFVRLVVASLGAVLRQVNARHLESLGDTLSEVDDDEAMDDNDEADEEEDEEVSEEDEEESDDESLEEDEEEDANLEVDPESSSSSTSIVSGAVCSSCCGSARARGTSSVLTATRCSILEG